jgi:hypothetical protein
MVQLRMTAPRTYNAFSKAALQQVTGGKVNGPVQP